MRGASAWLAIDAAIIYSLYPSRGCISRQDAAAAATGKPFDFFTQHRVFRWLEQLPQSAFAACRLSLLVLRTFIEVGRLVSVAGLTGSEKCAVRGELAWVDHCGARGDGGACSGALRQ